MSRRKFAIPQTMVPGATRRIDPDTLLPKVSAKNKVPLWDMPTPVRYVEHTRRRLNKRTKEVITDKVMVPIYRGISTSIVRHMRAEHRRTQRKALAAAIQKATAQMQDSK